MIGWVVLIGQPSAQVKGISHAEALARAYDAILDSRFDQARAELHRACEPTTAAACDTLIAAAAWWEIQLDPASQARDDQFLRDAERALATTEAWKSREPLRAEASFFLGGAYGARAQWRVLRGQPIAASRDGKRIKAALEQAVALDPQLHDAYFGIGLYHYYADVAPTYAKMLRFLLLLPGGDKTLGLKEMLQARERGTLMRGEADFQLHLVYLWYERQPRRAIRLLDELRGRYPHNPVFPQRIAEIESDYLQDHEASLSTWRALADAAQAGRVAAAPLVLTSARLGLAKQLNALSQPSRAVDVLKTIVAARPTQPYSALALAYFQLGGAYDRLGQRDAARTAYQSAFDAAPRDDPSRIRTRARRAITELQRR